jgi:hypothetical protein
MTTITRPMGIKDKNILAIGLGIILVIISNVIGHFAAPFSIFVSPLLLTVIIAGINAKLYKSNFILTVIYNFGLLLFNNLFIRLYAGGGHDQEGKGWIFLFFAITFILASITMTIYSFATYDSQRQIGKNVFTNFFILLLFTVLTGIIYYYVIADL